MISGALTRKVREVASPPRQPARTRRVGAQAVLLDDERVFRLQDLDRRVAAVAVVRTEHAVAVVVDRAAPAAPLDVIVRVVIPVLGMKPTKQEIAGGRAFGGGDPLRHRPRQRPHDDVLDMGVGLGVSADRWPGMLDVDQCSRPGHQPDRPVGTRS